MPPRLTSLYMLAGVLLAASAIVLGGCATLAPTDPYADAPPTRHADAQPLEAPSAQPNQEAPRISETTEKLTLDECIAFALENNPGLLTAGAEFDTAEAEAWEKGAARWPHLRLSGSYFHHQHGQRLGPPTAPGEPVYYTNDIASADVLISIPLYAGGRIVNEFRAATLLAKAAGHTFARSEEELAFNVTSAYFGILAQQEIIKSTAFSREVLSQHLARIEQLIAARKAARVDALRTEVQLAEVEQQLVEERNRYEIQRRLLANLLGLEESYARDIELAEDLTLDELEEKEAVEDVVARAYRQRPDYAAAIAELEAQAKQVDVARGAREPTVSLEASYGGRWGFAGSGDPSPGGVPSLGLNAAGEPTWTVPMDLPSGDLSATWGPDGFGSARFTPSVRGEADSFRDEGRVGVTVEVPLFEGGRIRAATAAERAKLRAARQRLRKLELDIRLEAETAMLNMDSALQRVRVAEKSIAEAEESLDIEQQKYELGKGAIVDVLDAQEALLRAQTNHHQALADYHVAKAEVQLATGDRSS